MATYDLVGMPFPSNDPEFVSDSGLQKKIRQLENYFELLDDLRNVSARIDEITVAKNRFVELFQMGFAMDSVSDALACAAVVEYAKCFNASNGRTTLNAPKIFVAGDDLAQHESYIRLRDKFFAHHEVEANRSQLFVFQASENRPIRINRSAPAPRLVISRSVDWEPLRKCVSTASGHTEKIISSLCDSIENRLTQDQQNVINVSCKDKRINEDWRASGKNRRDPLSIRGKP